MLYLQRLAYRHFNAIAILAILGIVAALFVGGRQPIAVGLISQPWDKVVHAGVFALLACTIGLSSNLRGWHKLAVAFFGALLVGALDEWHQMYLPGREAALSDFIADVIGSIFGTAFLVMKSSRSLRITPKHRGSFALMRSTCQGNSHTN
ncbi:VanZ family protein [Nitrosovibrio sp. Nv6]|uniref:VanZ family protein n=1 Tax=Nitrosovibrio sp. Nv6 TaxID=1855340 RepID=UPI0008B90BBF|nr:VanZ family protein [Nitrosovibrio sp. Nv6]SEP42931.1 VanZ like family protein [Nitrosovibrio sp. Nv6]